MSEQPQIINSEDQGSEYNHSSERVDPELFKCDKCNKHYKKKYNLKKHIENKHKINEALKLMLHNGNLRLQIGLYCDQIKILKRLILIQDHTLRKYGVKNTQMNEKSKYVSNISTRLQVVNINRNGYREEILVYNL